MNAFRMMILLLGLVFFSVNVYALPFSVVPKANTQLPTTVVVGFPVNVYYTVSNLTHVDRQNVFVKYLPLNVTQVTTAGTYSDTCGANFSLSANGSVGDSCTLQLQVNGSVTSADANPHHHLFVCAAGGKICAGTLYPLNITALPTPPLESITISPATIRLSIGYSQQFSAIGTYRDGSTHDLTTQVGWLSSNSNSVTINSSGNATAVAAGSATITASLNSISSNSAIVTAQNYLYVTNGSGNNVSFCPMAADGSVGAACSIAGVQTNAEGIFFHPTAPIVYLTDVLNNKVNYCLVNADGTFGTCQQTATSRTFSYPTFMTINPQHTLIYISDSINDAVVHCTLNADYTLTNCVDSGPYFDEPQGIAFNSSGNQVYVPDQNGGQVEVCNVNTDGSFSNCQVTGGGFSFSSPSYIVLNPANTFAYISNPFSTSTVLCTIQNDGTLNPCSNTGTGLDVQFGLTMSVDGSKLYAANILNNAVTYCNVDASLGGLSNCTVYADPSFAEPVTMAIH